MIFLKRKQETEVGHGECRGKAKGLLFSIMPSRLVVATIPMKYPLIHYGSSEKSGGQLRFAWKAIHIACDVGNRGQA